MSIVCLTKNLLATVQDLGRNKFRRFGINPNGAMDDAAARIVNILLDNDENEGVLEMHFPAPQILFEESAIIALGGADFGAEINGKKIENWRPVLVEKKSVLSFPVKISGNRIYLSVKGGFEIEKWLGSVSTNLKAKVGGFDDGKSWQKGDRLVFRNTVSSSAAVPNIKVSKSLIPNYSAFPTVRVIAGAEFEKLSKESKKDFTSQSFAIRHESDRMGFRLNGERLNLAKKFELISSAVSFGTVQLLPDGQLIILMADHQTTGGYPRIAHIINRDLPLAAQLGANDKLNFKPVTINEAENLIMDFERDLNFLKIACQFR
jgi:antagonist of KipI